MSATTDLDLLTINTLRTLSIDAVQKANSGHPGLPLGAAPMAQVLWQRHLKFDPQDPHWPDRDRFVLSAGHGSALLYSLLHLYGFDLPLAQLQAFRQWGSVTPGHPEWHFTPGVEATTGPLGQGAANAVGMAIAERYHARMWNQADHTIVDHFTYALVSDGDLMEGVVQEAASLAGHLGLGKLIYLYDANDITLDGPLSLSFSEDVGARFAAMGWHVVHVADGNRDLTAIDAAIRAAKDETARPSIIIVKTTIGFGSPKKAGSSSSHGSPLGGDEVKATKAALGWDPERSFYIPDEAKTHAKQAIDRGAAAHAAWKQRLGAWRKLDGDRAKSFDTCIAGKLPDGWDAKIPSWKAGESVATRNAAGKVMTAIASAVPWLLGGDADLGGSTKTIVGGGDYVREGGGRNLRFGIREHGMGAIANGLHYHGGIKPFSATFFAFSDYMRPTVRLAALNGQPVIFVWTHDSVGLGEDGPTHQPVEHLMALRAIPNLDVMRPCDANETAAAWRHAMTRTDGPVGLVLSRQDLPVVAAAGAPGVERGAYVLVDAASPKMVLIATGSEVAVAIAAQQQLTTEGIPTRVVSMPCVDLFARQDVAYRASVLPAGVPRVSVEAGITMGWREWIGDRGVAIGIDRYGASAPGEVVLEKLGITPAAVVAAARTLL